MMVRINYHAIAFDFDGVIKKSNDAKGHAFLRCFPAATKYQAEYILKYHLENPAISRSQKINTFAEYLGQKLSQKQQFDLLEQFNQYSLSGVLGSEWVCGVHDFLEEQHKVVPLYIVTATPQFDIESILEKLSIAHFFQGVYGYPKPKCEALREILSLNQLQPNQCMFFGDAESDYNAAQKAGVEFCLITSNDGGMKSSLDCVYTATDFLSAKNILFST